MATPQSATVSNTASREGCTVTAHVGDNAVLLAFDLDPSRTENLAGFAIKVKFEAPGRRKSQYFLHNRLNFDRPLTKSVKADPSRFEDSNKAPFQMFHWAHFPRTGFGNYVYEVYPAYYNGDKPPRLATPVPVAITLSEHCVGRLALGFTRSYISSQAYADTFDNAGLRPPGKAQLLYDTAPFLKQYEWLGAGARRVIFSFLQDARNLPGSHLDVLAYDLDEPDIVRQLVDLARTGHTVRMLLDDSDDHAGLNTPETEAAGLIAAAGGNVVRGHFRRFAHDKIMILKRSAQEPVKFITGSANFSLRGLYVQANSVLEFDDVEVAALYEQVFESVFSAAGKFRSSPFAAQWFSFQPDDDSPSFQVSFAPHPSPPFSTKDMAAAMAGAKSSVLFAVMEMRGTGEVMTALKQIATRPGLVSLGTIDKPGQLKMFQPGSSSHNGIVSYDFLKQNVPAPFKKEWKGGQGQVIHHKFVVCDFNGETPVVFCGSSNLAAGGETDNGDNLLAIYDRKVAAAYAVEAVRLFDHYKFRCAHSRATRESPLELTRSSERWLKDYYDPSHFKCTERQLLVRP